MKLKTLIESMPVLNEFTNRELPTLKAYKLAKWIKNIQPQLEAYDKVRNPLLKKYGTLAEGSNKYEFTPENQELFTKEIDPILDQEIPAFEDKFLVSELGEKIDTQVFISLDWLITE